MTGRPDEPLERPWAPEIAMAALFAFVTGLFALLAPGFGWLVIGVAMGSAIAGLLLRRYARGGGREGALVLTIVAVAVVTATAPPTLAAEVLAGFSAMAAVLWAAADPQAPSSLRYRTSGIVLPGLAVAVAVIVSGILPSSPSAVGIATGLVLAVVFWVAYVLSRPDPFRVTGKEAESS